MILERWKKSKLIVFLGGIVLGGLVEYSISLFGELMFHVKWWDYSDMPFNINGRICILYSVIWGVLAVFLIYYVNPKLDKLINRFISEKWQKRLIIGITVFMFIDWLISSFAMQMFYTRMVTTKDIEIQTKEEYMEITKKLYAEEWIKNLVDTVWSDERMIKTFPNLRVNLINGEPIYVRDLYPEIKPYYVRIFTPPYETFN